MDLAALGLTLRLATVTTLCLLIIVAAHSHGKITLGVGGEEEFGCQFFH